MSVYICRDIITLSIFQSIVYALKNYDEYGSSIHLRYLLFTIGLQSLGVTIILFQIILLHISFSIPKTDRERCIDEELIKIKI